jgi:hypothetical protein
VRRSTMTARGRPALVEVGRRQMVNCLAAITGTASRSRSVTPSHVSRRWSQDVRCRQTQMAVVWHSLIVSYTPRGGDDVGQRASGAG